VLFFKQYRITGGVAQVVGPEFKPQYHHHHKKKTKKKKPE
jgi:hypothetical protein